MEQRITLNKNIDREGRQILIFEKENTADIVLPDYCDDINRIIRVDARPILKDKYAAKDSIRLSGMIAVSVIYISEPYNQLRSFSFTSDFDYNIERAGVNQSDLIAADMAVSHLGCRLQNPRKLAVKIEIGVRLKVFPHSPRFSGIALGEDSEDMSADSEIFESAAAGAEKLQHRRERMLVSSTLVGNGEVRIEENIVIPNDMPAVSEIIYADVNIVIDDIKPLYAKAAVKFTANVKCLYSSLGEESDYITITKKIPSTHIIDIDDLDEGFECFAKGILSGLKTDIDIDPYGENRIINLGFSVDFETLAMRNHETEIISDAFSTRFESTSEMKSFSADRFVSIRRERREHEDSSTLEDVISGTVKDITGIVVIENAVVEGSRVNVQGSAEMSVMVRNREGELQNFDCTIPVNFDLGIDESPAGGQAEVSGVILEAAASIDGERLSVRLSVMYECIVTDSRQVQIMDSIIIHNENPKQRKDDVQMIIYYPNRNENLWDIAKRYNADIERLTKINKCENANAGDKKIIMVLP